MSDVKAALANMEASAKAGGDYKSAAV